MTPVKAINHIGIAVRSIEAQLPFYMGALGAVFEGVEDERFYSHRRQGAASGRHAGLVWLRR